MSDDVRDVREYLSNDAFARMSGITITAVDGDTATCEMLVTERHLNANGTIMGGALFTLADYCYAVAANNNKPPTVGSSGDIHFLRPAKLGEVVVATATPIKEGRRLACYSVDMVAGGKRIAYAVLEGVR